VTVEIEAVWSGTRWQSPDGRFFYDQAAADRAAAFFPTYLRHHIGHFDGERFTLLPYQEWLIVRPLFGWKRDAGDGLPAIRRFRKLFGFLPKGAGKSPLGAGLGFYLAFCCDEAGAEVYAVASERKQAGIVHDGARIMTETIKKIDPEMGELLIVTRDEIERVDTHSKFIVLSADAASKHGYRPFAVVMDEMHAQKNRDLYEVLWRSMIKRREPLMLILTHAGHDDEGICYEEYEYSKRVLSGSVADTSVLPVMFEARADEDPFAEATWRRVNPGHGITIQHEAIVGLAHEAQAEPRKRNDFLMWQLNRWVNQATAWIPADWWDACNEPLPADEVLATLPCAAGLDLAQKWDLACLSVMFRVPVANAITAEVVAGDEVTGITKASVELNYRIVIVPYFWIPEETMRQREREDGVPYSVWADLGLVTVTEGTIIDYSRIYQDITTKILARFPRLKQGIVGYDPAFATDIATQLRDRGGVQVEEVLQNYKYMSEPCHVFEALIKAKRVTHGAHRVLRNHVEHVAVKRDDAGRIRPVKPKKAGKHIDGVVSSLMALKMLAKVPDQAASGFWGFVVG